MPGSAFIAMGMHEQEYRGAGWFDDYTVETYESSGHDAKTASAAAKEDIQGLTKTLYKQALQKEIEGLIPTFVLFEIDLNKTSESIHFYWDVNEKYGVFTDSNIEASAIRVKDYINVK